MKNEIIIPVEYRADESRDGPGRLVGTLLTYGKQAGDRREMFEQDALYWRESGIIIREQHNRQAPILKTIPILDGATLRIDAPFPATQRGRDAATNLREGVYTGLSVEFAPEREIRRSGLRVIQRAFLDGAGLVDYPSYTDSVAEVRAENPQRRRVWLWL